MPVYSGDNKIKKIFLGGIKIKRAYLGNSKVWSGASLVTYYIDSGTAYEEEVDEGETVLSPSTFTPAKSGYTFHGWREDNTASSTVLSSKTAEGDRMYLYAVFKKNVTVTKYNGSNSTTSETKQQYYNNTNVLNPSFTLSENALSGWNKAGWTTSASSYSANLSDGQVWTISSNKTIYSLYYTTISCSVHCTTRVAWGQWVTDYGNVVINVHNATTYQYPTFGPYTEYDLNGPIGMTGWAGRGFTTATSGGASAISIANGGTITLTASATFYACYQRTVTVSYNANGGTSGVTNPTYGTAYYHTASGVTNANVAVSANGYAVAGYTFRRWRLNGPSGTAYTPGSTYTSYVDAVMYAEWVAAATDFGYTGGVQAFTALAGVTYLFQVWGAQGGQGTPDYASPGLGGYAYGYKSFPTDTTLYICVGGAGGAGSDSTTPLGGFNGGGYGLKNWNSGGGGGATHIGLSNATLQNTAAGNVFIVAGGGGGSSRFDGGSGGGASGGNGAADNYLGYGGAGGTQTSAGYKAGYGKGGDGTGDGKCSGGGGGWYGGGVGQTASITFSGGGGGGGSGYIGGVTSGGMSNGAQPGNGYCRITAVG